MFFQKKKEERTMDFTLQQILLLLFIIFPTMIRSKRSCPTSYCQSDKITPIRYPFTLETNPKKTETCQDYIILKCNNQGKIIINLPSYGDFEVSMIAYFDRVIALTDPGNCMGKRLMQNLSLQPMIALSHAYYTYYTCPRKLSMSPFSEIQCLSNSTNVTLATSQHTQEEMKREYGCVPIASTEIPVSPGYHDPDGILNELELTWGGSGCKECEDYGFDEQGDSRSKADRFFRSPIFVTIAAILGAFSVVVMSLLLMKTITTRRSSVSTDSNLALTTSVSGSNPVTAQSTTIESTTESLSQPETKLMVLSESQSAHATCSICLEEFVVGGTVRCLTQCGHYFHAQCIDTWLQKNGICPVCRK